MVSLIGYDMQIITLYKNRLLMHTSHYIVDTKSCHNYENIMKIYPELQRIACPV